MSTMAPDELDELEELDDLIDEPDDPSEPDEPSNDPHKSDQAALDPNLIPFTHLHVHSHYSLLDGAGKIDALIERAKELGMTSLALTDHGNMHGVLEFYQKCIAAGIKPIPGFEAYIAPNSRFERATGPLGTNFHLTLLAMNRTGFQNLMVLSSKAFLEGFYYKPRIDKEILEQYSEGLICLSGCVSGEVARLIANGHGSSEAVEQATQVVRWYKNLFGDRYYIEIQDHNLPIQQTVLPHLAAIARELDIPLVATNDVHYVRREDSEAQDILLCINTGKFRTDVNRMRMDSDLFYLRSGQEMAAAFRDYPEAISTTVKIADRCCVELELGKRFFPNFTPPDGKSSGEYLRELCLAGLKRRYADNPKRCQNGELSDEVLARLERELLVINKLGFANYFLIVWDFVRFAEERGIQRTARGSGVGALVCYALNLSYVCPLEFDLLFERFLDENRLEAPDIDIDFDQQRRGEILDYVKKKYGEANVAQIGTFGTMAARMAIKDVGRALGLPLPQVNSVSNLVPLGPKVTLAKAFKENPELTKVYNENRDIHELLDYAKKVEGLARSAGTHACAVVISQRPLTEFVPIQHIQGKGDDVTQWAAGDVEAAGLLKMDFLGLRNLTILSNAIALIEQTTGQKINPYKLPLDDKETYALLCRGETKGVFQLESGGMRELLARMKPDHFRDIIATLALYRPGPLEGGMVTDYIDVKHGRKKASYAHPVLEDVLTETNGVMVYQEQIMRIFNRLGNIPLSKSYSVIKAISKKKQDKIEKNREDFVRGAQENGLTEKAAREIFALIEKFAGYGFNKSHSTAYALIAYITAYLKAHYPAEFMAALLNGDISNRNFQKKDSTVEHLEDCKRMGIEVTPPDVNRSFAEYRVKEGKIAFGLTAIKGCGEEAVAEMVRVREEGGPFKSLFDFYERIESRIVSRAFVESLIKAGAFDSLGGNRSQLIQVLEKAQKAGLASAHDRARGQKSLFETLDDEPAEDNPSLIERSTVGLPNIPEWDDRERAANEKEVLGFYLTAHPLHQYEEKFRMFTSHTTAEALRLPDRAEVIVGGMISSIKCATTKNPKEGRPSLYAMFDLEDVESTIRTIAWPEQYKFYMDRIQPDAVVIAVGRIDRSRSRAEDDANLIVEQVLSLEEAQQNLTQGIRITLRESDGVQGIEVLYDILKMYRTSNSDGCDLEICIKFSDGRINVLKTQFRVNIHPEIRSRIGEQFGKDSFRLIPAAVRQHSSPNERRAWKKKENS